MIIAAAQFATNAHLGQFRKYTGDPYIYHPMRVAGRVSMLPGAANEHVAAAWLHDIIEDCPSQEIHLVAKFSLSVVERVRELTNPSRNFPKLPRRERKAMDFAHLAVVSRWAKVIKLLDRIDNLREMSGEGNWDFRHKYANESLLLVDAVLNGIVGDAVVSVLVQEVLAAVNVVSGQTEAA